MSASRAMRPHPFTVSRRAILAGGTVSALAVLAACSSNSASQETSPAASGGASTGSGSAKSLPKSTVVPTELDSGLGSGQADGVFPRTVVHYQGETTINAAPTKVVVISTGQADAMLSLGMCPIGSTTASGAEGPIPQYLKDAYPDQASAIETITKVGSRTEPDIEAIGALKPDLILTNIAGKDDADTLYKNFSAIAPTVVMRGTGQFWKTDLLLLADALGKREAAQSLLDTLKKEATEAGSALSSAGTISLLRRNSDKLRIFGPISFAGSVVADMGLQRPDTQQFTDGVSKELSSETLDQADGDWLFYGIQGGKDEELTGQALWGSLKAVSAGHAVKVDDDPFFLNAGPTAARVVRDQIVKAVRG
ncbi:iron-siderophore ABC transporter substrate-binding protein [Arachnia propionica]|uniref:iron-siderophore ABC transporter substrate-binding protein n=1 Tax=Arachnia propionica TaxID=1750 RepID=UPI0028D8B5DC|nr:iron-siderophore ABC transporter substrate-binding protein [Arachnia propionica]